MKKISLALIVILLFGVKTIKAQEQELSASEPISSGCVSNSRGAENSTSPTIKLTKEENILSVELLNYTSNCGTTGFEVENKIIDGNNENPTVAINVTPVIPAYKDCTCPFNISYTVRDLEKNKFYLTCWWYEGQVELTEGEPLVLEYQTKDVVIDGLKFRLLKVSHQAILISQNTWDNNVTTLQIPSEVEYEGEKYTVTSVNQNVSFSKNSSITKIIIPKTVKNTDFGSNEGFKYNPFVDCFSVESIEVEEGNPAICSVDGVLFNKDTTTLIGYPAASARESYTVPASVKTAGDGAFFNSKYLKKIVLPDNIETLGYSLFASSKSLEEVTLPSSIKELSIYLFKDCTKLKSVVIPEGVTTIGYSAFEGCSRLESISLPESINFIDFFAFGSLSNLKNVYCQAKIVPNTSQNVFGNVNLSKVTLHVPAASISAYQATEPWKNFKEIVELPDQATSGDSAIIDGINYHLLPSVNEAEVIKSPNSYTGNIEIPEKVVYNGTEYRVTGIEKSAFSACKYLTSVTIPNSVTIIKETTFANCFGLTSVNIPNSVTSIGKHAFYGCNSLTSVSIPNSVTEILNSAFRDCSSLTSVTIPNSVAEIEEGAFAGCSGLKSIVVERENADYDSREECNAIIKTSENKLIAGCMNTTIPNSVTTISQSAFFKCAKLTSITIPNGMTKIGSYAFQECSGLTSVTIPSSVTEIGDDAFYKCNNLRSLTIHDGVVIIGNEAFAGCQSLTSVIIPNSVTIIGEKVFNACGRLTTIDISNNVTSIGSFSFADCKRLTSVTIPNSVKEIGDYAFNGCSNVTSVTIGNNVDSIGYRTFGGCKKLLDVYCYSKRVPEAKTTFDNTNIENVTLHVPAASISAYQATEPWKNFKEIVALPAQDDYHPFVENGKEWTMAYLGTVGPEYQHTFSYQQIKLGSAIEVDGITFKQIVKSSWQNDQDGPTNWKETTEYVGEADGKVYIYNQQTKNTVQVMDFTLKVGDTYRQTLTGDPKNGGWDFVVTAVKDTVIATSADKTPRKCLHLSFSDSKETDDVWVEGIGSLYGGVQGAYGRVKAGAISMLRICKADEQTLYEAYHPFLKEGKTWNYQEYYHNLWDDEQWTKDVSYVINGTTEIDGKTYYKMYRISEEGSKYYCALREEDRKVWLYTSDDGDQLLYDFGMSVGDSYTPSDESIRYQLTAIKPMRFQYYQLLNVLHYDVSEQYDPTEPYEYIGPEQIVEGVGCEKGWNIMELYAIVPPNGILHGENFLSCYEDGKCIFTADDFNGLKNTKPDNDMAYRPFIEEGKVWKVGTISGNPVQVVDYYYFDGDTIIGGRTCKQMMRQRYVSPDYPEYDNLAQLPTLSKVGAWYEKDKKVYFYNEKEQSFMIKYDFSIGANESLQLIDDYPSFIIGPRQTGEIDGFKGVYRDVMINQNVKSTTWLEGVGGIEGPTRNAYAEATDHMPEFLMSCAVGDEVIYLNEKYEDGATPEGARKDRFDFTHTIKNKPKAPRRSEDAQSLYGEYNNLQLGINLNPLDDTYQVSITNESGKVVYEKAINAGNIVGLNIDISAYAKGRYTVTVENSQESFTGEFETQTTGIEENVIIRKLKNVSIYNLQGQRINYLQKGLNIVNGKKVYVK